MKKNYLYTLAFCLLCTAYAFADTQKKEPILSAADDMQLESFDDLFDDANHVIEFHDHIEEEVELVALEAHATKPTKPSELTVAMRKLGLRALIGYIAIRTYFEQFWDSFKSTVTRLGNWLSGDHVSQA